MNMISYPMDTPASTCLRAKAAQVALEHVMKALTPSSVIGIGTGATVEVFIQLLKHSGATFSHCVSSSKRSSAALAAAGINELPIDQCDRVDFYVDGIDEGLSNGTTVKGGGAALAREKVLATLAMSFITIADSGRLKESLGEFPLPIEVLPAAELAVLRALQSLGGNPIRRKNCVTDNGNLIIDCAGLDLSDSTATELSLNSIPGVVENGIFSRRKADFMAFSGESGVEWFCRN
ncbi:Ribose 5-phosphate epimerase [Vibrio mediterranei AK1]|uniref:ribose-5-phosphate isomerase RpiA n=1 Tax=Vibrio mediterranei TaxID=689 RepID=UPI0001541629|nr:Ribose 5-phosphate epimerase [Vibrio mediterranei AK1]